MRPFYVSIYFSSHFGKKSLRRYITGATNSHINPTNLARIKIPVPPLEVQDRVIGIFTDALHSNELKEAEAQALLDSIDDYLFEQLGLAALTGKAQRTFTLTYHQLSGKRFDALAYRPQFAGDGNQRVATKPLWHLANINSHSIKRPEDDETHVPYIGLPECDINDIREVALRPYKEVKGRSVVKPGDILFARIEPSVFNKKYVLADDLKGHSYAYTSTEFYVVTPKHHEINRDYLYAMFFSSFVFSQVKGKTTGSSGRRRIDPTMFSELQIPLPENREVQEAIAAEVVRRRKEAKRLRAEGTQRLERAKQEIERIILGEQA